MSSGRRSRNSSFAPTWQRYAGGTLVDCVAVSPDGATCARSVVLLSAGDFTVLKDVDGVDKPFTGAPANYVHLSDVSAVNATVPFIVHWGNRDAS
jgi:hypothetical protein